MPLRGRPPATRNVHSFQNRTQPIPGELLLDTSFVVEALITTQPLHTSAVEFLVEIAEAGVRVRYSALLELELAEASFQLALKERHKRDWKRFRYDGRARPRGARLMEGTAAAWAEVLKYVNHQRVGIDEVVGDVSRLMADHGMASYDAVHAATALRSASPAIVTTDVGFAALPSPAAVIFTDSSRLARCRELRARRG
jgi:predicted nucleic acid-binding protein